MRVLLLTQVVPNPPDAGPKVKTHYVLRTLAREHSVELLSFARDEREVAAAEGLRDWCEHVSVIPLRRVRALEPVYAARGWAAGVPFLVARDARRAMADAIRERLSVGDIDVLHADQLSMAQYLPLARGTAARTVFDAHNAVWELVREVAPRQRWLPLRLAAATEWRLLRRYERWLGASSDLVLCVSERDRDALMATEGKRRAAVIPIGVEVEETTFAPPPSDATHLLSVATMHYPPNAEALRWFRDAIWPLLADVRPEVSLDIAGTKPPVDLVGWGQDDARVAVHGYVSDLGALYGRAAAFIVPLRAGSGVRVKILEAMARGVPVVSTSVGVDGLALRDGEHLLIADTPGDFATAIARLLDSQSLRVSIAEAARAYVLKHYDWRRCCDRLLDVYDDLPCGGRCQAGSVKRC